MRRSYVVEILFTLILFTVFVVGSFFILLTGANAYQKQITQNNSIEQLRLPLSYISTKLHQADGDLVAIQNIEGIDCLLIEEEIDGKLYVNMIYHRDGNLYESFSAKEIMSLDNGEKVCEINELKMAKHDNSYYFEVINDQGDSRNLEMVLR
ncbi:MAG: DUF4860 domain-containing protein [Erysipelotrichaceae bacterium]|nr:DUF4860 domain-containing protein [Erysipelotrichaceae bacterium]MDY5251191.1 DUF4860 domain-containing protein [Erysipelotrichaceae bacterium]